MKRAIEPTEGRGSNAQGTMNNPIKQYLTGKTTLWLERELEQAHALASDDSAVHDKRESALAAAVMMAEEISSRPKP